MIDEITEGIYQDYPELLERYGERGREKCREDNQHHFHQLHTAYKMKNDQFFIDYANWLNGVLTSRGMKSEHLIDNFNRIKKSVWKEEQSDEQEAYIHMLQKANESLSKEKATISQQK
ncbi:hypothetical protein FCL54_23090 [Pseudalkalibacillus caeni]|uniref:Uncharacterized protein n=2 Tax=Exobacillus caeni TaxID=2574798 RepID=A0A5R9EXQ9_9BACL|nr:hypothetical protein FCL54_23090 [Pseudalkalibacillus caeni]